MFPRAQMKEHAKARMQYNQGTAIAVALAASLLGAGVASSSLELEFQTTDSGEVQLDGVWQWLNSLLSQEVLVMLAGLVAVAAVVSLLFGFFVSNVVEMGLRGWFLRYQRGECVPFRELFAAFRFYSKALVTKLLVGLYTFLWTLLFIIPGIVKSYAYSMTDYILCENPHLPVGRVIEMSQRMTDGYKAELFVLDLSWIGWNLLNSLTLGILGIVYLNPYIHTTHAAAYECLKANAIRDGRLTWEDFGQMPPIAYPESSAE